MWDSWRKAMRLFILKDYINPSLVCWGVHHVFSSHSHSRSHFAFGHSTCSCIHSCLCSLFTPLMDTSLHSLSHYTHLPHSRLVWERETNTIKFECFCDEVETNFRQHRVVFVNKINFFSLELILRSSEHTWIFVSLVTGKRILFTIGKCLARDKF